MPPFALLLLAFQLPGQGVPAAPRSRRTGRTLHPRHGETAINSGNYTFSELRDGKSVLTPARFTFVFHRREGKWMIVDHHSSRMPD